ncbi:MAG: amidohydrolase family protein [Ramlibacter sp.]
MAESSVTTKKRPCACGAVDVHTHFVPKTFPRYVGSTSSARWPSMAPAQECHQHVMLDDKIYRTVSDQCWEPPKRIADMDGIGIARQVLSPMPELLAYWLEPADARVMCRFLNESVAGMVAANPGRFSGLAAVPLQDVDAAIVELEYAVRTLHLAGVEIGTNINDVVIGDARFEPFFAAAEALGAAVFVHPLRPAGMNRLVGPPMLEQALAFPGESGLAAASLLTAGTLTRYPRLRIAFSHGGGSLLSLLPRLQQAWNVFPALKKAMPVSPADAARSLYFDNLVYDRHVVAQLLRVFGRTQIMVGTDYPFGIMERDPCGRLAECELDEETLRLVSSANALRWLGMESGSSLG